MVCLSQADGRQTGYGSGLRVYWRSDGLVQPYTACVYTYRNGTVLTFISFSPYSQLYRPFGRRTHDRLEGTARLCQVWFDAQDRKEAVWYSV